ncbi:uncharacterized membrane-anchored protein YhcB (DUF1043 family) [Variovorax paradoxus]|uniref:Uncharacterized membrane-anchored protein YhcB (DUF1043 family) n=1 Tax=Variovorax paradoxus TaxID=34073 RepID=A0AAE4BY75_VARPD|nr:hypothetical protein [Variovorax paradoxus]MDR6426709.1 uncharacterized membrane-anchored protein YhcB (DUF1043 family) [Variovorax paradoxus]
MQERMEESRLNELGREERSRLSARETELRSYRDVVQRQERELDLYRARLKEEQLAREREFQKELEAREKFFAERERKLVERQRGFEEMLMHRQAETDALRDHLQKEIAKRESELQRALLELQQEKDRYTEESRKNIERTSKDYVSDALDTLDRKESQFHFMSKLWSFFGAGALAAAIGFFGYITLSSAIALPSPITWEFLAFSVFKGLVAVALLAGLAKYSFMFSNSYMQEALKNADRRHAINFGKFYLESYGAAADWSQVKEAFEHWNITGINAFSRHENALPTVDALEKAVALVKRASNSFPKPKSDAVA